MRADRTGEVRRPRQPGLGKFRSRRPNPGHMRRGEWADAAPVSGIKCLGLVKSCPGDEFPVGAKFEKCNGPCNDRRPRSTTWVSVMFGYYKEGGAK
jgi:hypothetical protein